MNEEVLPIKYEFNREIHPYDDRYFYFYDPEHPLAMSNGCVLFHRHLASVKINRWLTRGEHAHHIDGNPFNNSIDNLEVLTASEHTIKHLRERHGSFRREHLKPRACANCKTVFTPKNINQVGKYCSKKCFRRDESHPRIRKVERPGAQTLLELVNTIPMTQIGKKFGVSDNAIRKWCKSYGINIPCRLGYWMKLRAKRAKIDPPVSI